MLERTLCARKTGDPSETGRFLMSIDSMEEAGGSQSPHSSDETGNDRGAKGDRKENWQEP
jgi:hypothetical protein